MREAETAEREVRVGGSELRGRARARDSHHTPSALPPSFRANFERRTAKGTTPNPRSQSSRSAPYIQLRGLPQTYDPKVEDPWDGLRGEGGASYWGSDPLEDVPGGTEGLKQVPQLRAMMQTLLVQVGDLASG